MLKTNLTAVLNTQRPDKYNKYPLRIRSIIQGKIAYYPTGIMLLQSQFENGEITNHVNKNLLNTVLRTRMGELEKKLAENSLLGESGMKLREGGNIKFFDYATSVIEKLGKTKVNSKSTCKHDTSYLNKFHEFKPNIKLKGITKDVLSEYELFCFSKKNNINNTVWSATKFMRKIINIAIDEELITKDPFKNFTGTAYEDPIRVTLSDNEIDEFEKFADNPDNPKKLRNAASWFIFSCYTGLRYEDMNRFNGFTDGHVYFKTHKTDELVSFIATPNIVRAYDRIQRSVLSNQKMNDYLKIIGGGLGIKKDLHCHIGRHTFAVKYLRLGGRLEVLQKLLGHTDITTTAIYGKIANVTVNEELTKVWGDKPKKAEVETSAVKL